MEINKPPFNEKQFLKALLDVLTKKYGQEQRFIFVLKFSLSDNDLADKVGNSRWDNQMKKAYTDSWAREANSRGLVDLKSQSSDFIITQKGYDLALRYKAPIKAFFNKEWRYLITTCIAILALIISAIALVVAYSENDKPIIEKVIESPEKVIKSSVRQEKRM